MTTPIKSQRTTTLSLLKLLSLLLAIMFTSSANSCTEEKASPVPDESITLNGAKSKEVTLYGNKYIILISKVSDNRCFVNPTSFGDFGLQVELTIKSNQDCENENCKSASVQLFLPNCDSPPISITDLFNETNRKRGVSSPAFDFLIGISDATPHQTINSLKKFDISDYELKLFTHKP